MMRPIQDDDLMLLWQQGASAEPDPAEIARLAGRASVTRFDRAISVRNFAEYAAGVVMLFAFGSGIVTNDLRVLSVVGFVCVGFIMAYLWWQHRDMKPLDPSADARAYRSAMLARIDRQIRLLRTVRYWYIVPIYIVFLWWFFTIVRMIPVIAVVQLIGNTGVCVGAVWLNERSRWGIPRLKTMRAKIEAFYEE